MGDADMNYLIIAAIAIGTMFLIILFVWVMAKCIASCRKKKNFEFDFDTNYSTQQLIPPIFYTDEIKDPLLQEDLIDKIPKDK